jgi:hypothetical protein
MRVAHELDSRSVCRVRPGLPGTARRGPAVPGERTDAVVARAAITASIPTSLGQLDAAARRHSRWPVSAGRRRAVAPTDDGNPVTSDQPPPPEAYLRAHTAAVLHSKRAGPGDDAVCVWCQRPWPCADRQWADDVLSDGNER